MDRTAMIQELTAAGRPYEVTQVQGLRGPTRAFRNAPKNLGEVYAEARSERDFLIYGDERLSFEETWRKAAALAAHLSTDLGVTKGERVAIAMRNYPEWILAFNAATILGAVAVALNAHWQPREMNLALLDCQPKVILVDQERWERLKNCDSNVRSTPTILVRGNGMLPATARHFGDLPLDQGEPPLTDVHPNDDAMMLFTSGSTGRPKGAVSTHRNIITALMSWELDGQIGGLGGDKSNQAPRSSEVALLGIPLFHVAGLLVSLMQCYRAQRSLVSMYKWNPEEACRLIERERVTHFGAPPAVTGDLVEAARRTKHDVSSLVTVGGGGAARAPEHVRSMMDVLPQIVPTNGWGMTETNGMGVGIYGDDYVRRPLSAGRLSAILDARIVDENGGEVPVNQSGELQVRGASVMRGYWNRDAENTEAFVDGWFRTGDIAKFDDNGYLYIVDRIKDLVIRGGENIGCGAVEAALLEHPHVLEASVYGVPDDRLGEEVGATVYARQELAPDELQTFVRSRLAAFEIPRFLEILPDPLPRTASGKIFRRQLRDAAVARLA